MQLASTEVYLDTVLLTFLLFFNFHTADAVFLHKFEAQKARENIGA